MKQLKNGDWHALSEIPDGYVFRYGDTKHNYMKYNSVGDTHQVLRSDGMYCTMDGDINCRVLAGIQPLSKASAGSFVWSEARLQKVVSIGDKQVTLDDGTSEYAYPHGYECSIIVTSPEVLAGRIAKICAKPEHCVANSLMPGAKKVVVDAPSAAPQGNPEQAAAVAKEEAERKKELEFFGRSSTQPLPDRSNPGLTSGKEESSRVVIFVKGSYVAKLIKDNMTNAPKDLDIHDMDMTCGGLRLHVESKEIKGDSLDGFYLQPTDEGLELHRERD